MQETLEENTSLANDENMESPNNQLQTVPMNASLNLDLDMFSIFEKPLSEWTYEDLCDYIYANYAETSVETMYDSYTGAPIRSFYDPNKIVSKLSISIIEGHSIQITNNNVMYIMNKSDWCRSLWSLRSDNPGSKDLVASICGQRIDTYLESICPGLYEKLQEEPVISLKKRCRYDR